MCKHCTNTTVVVLQRFPSHHCWKRIEKITCFQIFGCRPEAVMLELICVRAHYYRNKLDVVFTKFMDWKSTIDCKTQWERWIPPIRIVTRNLDIWMCELLG